MVTEIAERLSVSENEVVDMNRRLAGHDHSLNNPYSLDNTEEWINGYLMKEKIMRTCLLIKMSYSNVRKCYGGLKKSR